MIVRWPHLCIRTNRPSTEFFEPGLGVWKIVFEVWLTPFMAVGIYTKPPKPWFSNLNEEIL